MTAPKDNEEYLKRIFSSGYVLGRKHGYATAVDESYPELLAGQNDVGRQVGDAITDYLNPGGLRVDPNQDFG
jgi:hypothetical protein